MAAPTDLTDLFAKKKKKVFKGTNLNTGLTANKGDDKKAKANNQGEEGWQEEEVVATTLKVEVAGNLKKEDDKKDNEVSKQHWSANRSKGIARDEREAKRFPTLQGSQTNIKIGADEGKINIATSKNNFAGLENSDDDDEEGENKKPTKIVPAMVQKKRGETEKAAVQREVAKYADDKKSKKKKKEKDDDDEESEDEEESEEDDEEEQAREKAAKDEAAQARSNAKKAAAKKTASQVEKAEEEEEQLEEDCKIQVDLVKSKEKYAGRKKPFPPKPIDRSEREDEKAPVASAKAKANAGGGGKKKKFVPMEEDDKKSKLQYIEE